MSILGSAFGRGLAGAASAGADMANKYLDEQLMQQRAEAMATLQRKTAGLMRADDDAFRNDPTRIARDRGNMVEDIKAKGTATNETALAGKLAEAQSTALTQATVDRENALVKGTIQAKVDAKNAELNGTMGAEAKRAGLIARASDMGGGERAARTQLLNMEVQDKKRLGELYDKYTAVNNDATIPADQKAAALKPIEENIRAIKAKNGQVAQRDPELDTETVTEEKMNPDGTVVKTQRKQVRRPGEKSAAEKPPQDVAHAEAQAAIKSGASADAVNARLKSMGYAPLAGTEKAAREVPTRRLPASTERLTEAEWDRRFGKGDFKKQGEYKPGEDSLKAF